MKLYDYARKRNRNLKDIQWDQIDEEIRRIWDVLYNKREIYPNQVFDSKSNFFAPAHYYKLHNIVVGGQNPDATGLDQVKANFHAIGGDATYTAGIVLATAVISQAPVDILPFGYLVTATTASAQNALRLNIGSTTGHQFTRYHCPHSRFVVRTLGAAQTSAAQYAIGWFGPAAAGFAYAGGVMPFTTGLAPFNFVGFFKDVNNTSWRVMSRQGTSAAQETTILSGVDSSVTTITPSTVYTLELKTGFVAPAPEDLIFNPQGPMTWCYINGTLVAKLENLSILPSQNSTGGWLGPIVSVKQPTAGGTGSVLGIGLAYNEWYGNGKFKGADEISALFSTFPFSNPNLTYDENLWNIYNKTDLRLD